MASRIFSSSNFLFMEFRPMGLTFSTDSSKAGSPSRITISFFLLGYCRWHWSLAYPSNIPMQEGKCQMSSFSLKKMRWIRL
jgi:hypothetical protein